MGFDESIDVNKRKAVLAEASTLKKLAGDYYHPELHCRSLPLIITMVLIITTLRLVLSLLIMLDLEGTISIV